MNASHIRRKWARRLILEQLEPREVPAQLLLPDLHVLTSELNDWRVVTQSGHTMLQYTTAMANGGKGAFELRGTGQSVTNPDGTLSEIVNQRIYDDQGGFTDRVAGTFTYHPDHGHLHFDGFAQANLRVRPSDDSVGSIIVSGHKTSFDLLDIDQYDPSLPNSPENGYYGSGSSERVQGISVGWNDVYSWGLEGQDIDITGVPNGNYWLEVIADVSNNILESDETNNIARIPITLTGQDTTHTNFEVFAGSPLGASADAVGTVNLTFTRPVNPASFTAADVDFHGPSGDIPITSITQVNATQFEVHFALQKRAGTYVMLIGPEIADMNGNRLDQNNSGTGGEISDKYVNIFAITAPTVQSITPSREVANSVSKLRVSFSKPIDPTTFTVADVVSFQNPAGTVIQVSGIRRVRNSTTDFDLSFSNQKLAGTYTIVLGPDIRDTLGNALDESHNGIPGENPADRFTGAFKIASPRVVAAQALGTGPVSQVRVSFNKAMDGGSFTTADIVSLVGPGGTAIPVTKVAKVKGSSTDFDLTFPVQGLAGTYTLVLGPNIRDTDGNFMDQDGDGTPLENPGDRFTTTFQVTGPRIIASTPTGPASGPVTSMRLTFDRPINAATLTSADVLSFTKPNGSSISITSVVKVSDTQYDLQFASQNADGAYRLVLGTAIQDTYGNFLDQDGDAIPGESTADQFIANFSLHTFGPDSFGHTIFDTPYENISLDRGTTLIPALGQDGFPSDDDFAPVNLGSNTFTFYGVKYTGATSLYVGTNGVITFGAGTTSTYQNLATTGTYSLPTIAPLWDDWVAANAPMVRIKFEDINGDRKSDRLIIGWNVVPYGDETARPVTFQAILQLNTGAQDGDFIFNYGNLDTGNPETANGINAVVGIKKAGVNSDHLVVSDGALNPYIGSHRALRDPVVHLGQPDFTSDDWMASRALHALLKVAAPDEPMLPDWMANRHLALLLAHLPGSH